MKNETFFQLTFNNTNEGIVTINEAGIVELFNSEAERIFGHTSAGIIGKHISALIHNFHSSDFDKCLYAEKDGVFWFKLDEKEGLRNDYTTFPIDLSLGKLRLENRQCYIIAVRNATEQRNAVASLQKQQQQEYMEHQLHIFFHAIEQSPVSLIITSVEGKIEYVNPKFTQLTGYTADEVIGQNPRILKSGKTAPEEYRYLWNTITSGKVWKGELYNKKKNGEFYWEYASISPIKNADGVITHFMGIEEDITERKKIEAQMVHLAERDPLTNLSNRRCFQEQLECWLIQARRYNISGALLFLDLDNFKYVNDTLGHQTGDELLRNIAGILNKRLRETDIIARLGGDEFAILLSHVDADLAQSIATQIIESIRHHDMVIRGQSANVTVSIGIALFPDHGNTLETLLTHADLAMYRAKEEGRNRACVYAPSQKTKIESRIIWEKRIRNALSHDRFVLHLQPIVDVLYKGVAGYEALLRMMDENGEVVYPSNFLDVAEHFGLISEIDRWVVRKAISIVAEMEKSGISRYIGVNISGRAFRDPLLLPLIMHEIKTKAINPTNLVLEITETSIITNISEAQQFIAALKDIGCRFALDDFGTGFSSFSYLKHLPIDYLKIDGEFIRNLPNDSTDQHLVRAIVEVARGLGKQTVAEYVECEETVQLLVDQGVNFAQGYHIGMPV